MLHPYAHYLRRAAARHPDRLALVDPERGVTLTWAALAERVAARAADLAADGAGLGDRVLIRQANTHAYLEWVLATAWRGAAFVPVLGTLPEAEFVAVRDAVEPTAVRDARPAWDGPASWEGLGASWAATEAPAPLLPVDGPADTIGQILFTSGSSGTPKGVMHTFAASAAAMGGWSSVSGIGPGHVVLVTTPMSHAAGRLVEAALVGAGTVVIAASPKPAAIAAAVAEHHVTHVLVVPTVLQDLVDWPSLGEHDLSSLEFVLYASAPASPSLARRAHERLGPVLHTVYGSTEVAAPVTHLSAADHERAIAGEPELLTSCGREFAWGVQARILDDDGAEVPDGSPGQLALATPWLAAGYWRRPQEWAARVRDGWFLTGDVGVVRGGWLHLTDRRDDMIITGGFNVFPTEVEHVLAAHPAVREVAVFGAPDQRWGEAVVAAVSLRAPVEPAALVEHCRARLAAFKAPKRVVVLDDLPKTGHAKVSRRLAREAVVGAAAAIHGVE